MLILPEGMREDVRKPFGRVYSGSAAMEACRKASWNNTIRCWGSRHRGFRRVFGRCIAAAAASWSFARQVWASRWTAGR
ncbi:MAG: hypothetical protein NTX79_08910, partial [Candidatus Micrarchaeota archaeon]|nr:hypothetical protein [Candidatus Micrarchaeota archaeon]